MRVSFGFDFAFAQESRPQGLHYTRHPPPPGPPGPPGPPPYPPGVSPGVRGVSSVSVPYPGPSGPPPTTPLVPTYPG